MLIRPEFTALANGELYTGLSITTSDCISFSVKLSATNPLRNVPRLSSTKFTNENTLKNALKNAPRKDPKKDPKFAPRNAPISASCKLIGQDHQKGCMYENMEVEVSSGDAGCGVTMAIRLALQWVSPNRAVSRYQAVPGYMAVKISGAPFFSEALDLA